MPIEHPLVHITGQIVNTVVADASDSRPRGFTLTDARNFGRASVRGTEREIVGHYVRLVKVARGCVTRIRGVRATAAGASNCVAVGTPFSLTVAGRVLMAGRPG